VETIAFLEALVRALGHGWSARYGMIAPYGVFGVTLTSDVGGTVEIVPSLVRGEVVTWSPFVFTRGTPHYDVHTDDGELLRTPDLVEAVARLERWRRLRGPVARVAARVAARSRPKRVARITEIDVTPPAGTLLSGLTLVAAQIARSARGGPASIAAGQTLADALRDKKLGQIERARKLAKERDPGQVARELLTIARRSSGDARANALGVLSSIALPEHGPELARYLEDPARSVQSVAIDAVKRLGYLGAVPALAALVLARDGKPASGRSRLASSAATAMKVLSGKRGAAALTCYLTDDDPRVREAACVAFTMFVNPGTKVARPLLERLLADSDARVARAARRALASV
jgi:HEAT repeat protein